MQRVCFLQCLCKFSPHLLVLFAENIYYFCTQIKQAKNENYHSRYILYYSHKLYGRLYLALPDA